MDKPKIDRSECFSEEKLKSSPVSAISSFVKITDSILVNLFNDLAEKYSEKISLLAVGGYGREELCPYSDVDLLILYDGEQTDEHVARLVRAIWDTGLPLGCVVRNIPECRRIMGQDIATDTALLDMRYLAGSKHLYKRLVNQVVEPGFRHRRQWFLDEISASFTGGLFSADTSLYTVEPNLKTGVCTLRDCQRIIWGMRVADGKYTIQENGYYLSFDQKNRNNFERAYEKLLEMRCALHMTAGRRLDILEISVQRSVARYLGYGDDNAGMLMEDFFKTVHNVKQLLQLYLEINEGKKHLFQTLRWAVGSIKVGPKVCLLDGYLSYRGYLPLSDRDSIRWVLEVYLLSVQYHALPNTKLENHIRRIAEEYMDKEIAFPEFSSLFIELMSLRAPLGKVLRSMYETGFLYLLLPEFMAIKCKVEYDSYHEFTVDQHILYAFSMIDEIEKEASEHIASVFKTIDDIFVLRMAVLLHDIGKSPAGNHAFSGAMIAVNVADRFGINERKRDLIAFLIEYHLELSMLAFRREPEEHIIAGFADIVNNRQNLDLLYILTVIDIRSVGKKTWTVWKGMQLEAVYDRVKKYLNGNAGFNSNLNPYHNMQKDMRKYGYLFDSLSDADAINIASEKYTGFERLIIIGFDRPGFFADIAGCLSSEGYNILSAQIATEDNRVFDIFHVEPDKTIQIESAQHIKNICRKWDLILGKKFTTRQLIDERYRLYPSKTQRRSNIVKSEVLISNSISMEYTVIEIRTSDQFGLLFRVAQCLSESKVNIVSAKLSTRVAQAIDVFYVVGEDRKKIVEESRCEMLRVMIEDCLEQN